MEVQTFSEKPKTQKVSQQDLFFLSVIALCGVRVNVECHATEEYGSSNEQVWTAMEQAPNNDHELDKMVTS